MFTVPWLGSIYDWVSDLQAFLGPLIIISANITRAGIVARRCALRSVNTLGTVWTKELLAEARKLSLYGRQSRL